MLELIYTFREREKVIKFLERNRFLSSLLLEAYFKISNYFPGSSLFLEVDNDPEVTMSEQLLVFIATNLSPSEVLCKLKQFDEDWWLDNLDRAQMKLCINLEFE